jgi:hypothetical protein
MLTFCIVWRLKAQQNRPIFLLTEGYYDAHGTPVVPVSLYLKQLSERLGSQSLKNIN